MKIFTKHLSLFLLLILLISCIDRLDSSKRSYHTVINGTVLDVETEQPLDSVEVRLELSSGVFGWSERLVWTGYTDSAGKFTIETTFNSDDGWGVSYYLDFDKAGYYGLENPKIETDEVNNIIIYMRTYVRYYRTIAKGNFLEKDTKRPIENVEVFILRDPSGKERDSVITSSTNSNGYFYLEDYYLRDIKDITLYYEFQYQARGYDRSIGTYGLRADSTREFLIELTPVTD